MNRRDLFKMIGCLGAVTVIPAVMAKPRGTFTYTSPGMKPKLIRPQIRLRGEVAHKTFHRPGCDIILESFANVHHCHFRGCTVWMGDGPASFCHNSVIAG